MVSKRIVSIVTICFGMAAAAAQADERPLKGPEIDALISGNTVTGQNINGIWKQFFNVNGETIYVAPEKPPSYGEWNLQGDKFCSKWPPSDHYVCYVVTGDLDAKPKMITWIAGGSGTKYPGTVAVGKGL